MSLNLQSVNSATEILNNRPCPGQTLLIASPNLVSRVDTAYQINSILSKCKYVSHVYYTCSLYNHFLPTLWLSVMCNSPCTQATYIHIHSHIAYIYTAHTLYRKFYVNTIKLSLVCDDAWICFKFENKQILIHNLNGGVILLCLMQRFKFSKTLFIFIYIEQTTGMKVFFPLLSHISI